MTGGSQHCLVTGGVGFIGSHLTEELLTAGLRVTILDDLSTGHEDNLAAVRDHEKLTVRTPDQRVKLYTGQQSGPATRNGLNEEHQQKKRAADADSQPERGYSIDESLACHGGSFDPESRSVNCLTIDGARSSFRTGVLSFLIF